MEGLPGWRLVDFWVVGLENGLWIAGGLVLIWVADDDKDEPFIYKSC
jgi:hypothetical protein